jgi:hypothetical protein
MDKEWQERINQWIKEKATTSRASLAHSVLDNPPYRSTTFHADGSTMYPQSTHNSSLYHQPSFSDARDTYAPAHSSDAHAGFSSGVRNRVGGNDDVSDNENEW